MTKRVYIIIALTLCLALLAGCAASASAPSAAVEPTATPSPTATPEPPSTRPDPTAVPEKNGMYELLSGVFDNYHFGTAGSSLICAWYAASIVDWGVKNGGSAVVNGARAWDRGPETEFGESFEDKLASVYAAALSLYGAGTGILDDCGWQGEWTYSAADVRAVFEPLFPALGMSPPFAVRVYYPDGDLMYLRVQGMVLDRSETVDITQTLNTVLAGYVFNDGALIADASLESGVLTLDINDGLAAQIRAYGTSGELLTVASVVNTALDAFSEARSVRLFYNGAPLETGHNIYDEPMGFFEEF